MTKHELKEAFLKRWPIERLKDMSLQEYTNLDKESSFCYGVEFKTLPLGKIGGTSYKFGIYHSGNQKKDERRGYDFDGTYKWVQSYGLTPEKAFQNVRENIVKIAGFAQAGNLREIEEIRIAENYKWKVAFLYSDYKVVNIFKVEALQYLAKSAGLEKEKDKDTNELHTFLISQKPKEKDYFEYCDELWRKYANNDGAPAESDPEIIWEDGPSEPLNQILFGPPGTGKTFHTVNRALSIISPQFYLENRDDRAALRKKFDKLLITDWENPKGQIAFCTFHQAFAYEDFIEGIKPIEPQEGDEFLKYEVQDGIFKKLCEVATSYHKYQEEKVKSALHIPEDELGKTQFYKISLGNTQVPEDEEIYRYCIENNCISIGYGEGIDFSGKKESEVWDLVNESKLGKFTGTAVNTFANYIKENYYVVVSNGNLKARAIGKVVGPYEFREDSEIGFKHFRKVEWLISDEDIPVEEIYEKSFSQQTIYKLQSKWIKKEFFAQKAKGASSEVPKKRKKYTLIIDEINRGNVAQIFGELITLIEKDKRDGGPERLEVTLPYSKTPFSVPPNLYIIGTMNTADRSVEALDTALRRRFHFEEMPPKPEILDSSAKMLLDLWWKYENEPWEDETYAKAEKDLFNLIGTPERYNNKKGAFWDSTKADPDEESQLTRLENGFDFPGISLGELLETINNRIRKLLDKDHLIGHSYFMGIRSIASLRVSFHNKIIPLLQEYFFGDFAKIGLVVGRGFFKNLKKDHEEDDSFFADFDHDASSSLLSRPVWELEDVSKMKDDDFLKALNQLLRNG